MSKKVVGVDWPDHFYPTNAVWPSSNNWSSAYNTNRSRKTFDRTAQSALLKEQQQKLRKYRHVLKKHLFDAISQGDVSTSISLIERDASLLEAHTSWGATPLAVAAALGDTALVSELLVLGADPGACDSDGATPLISAAFRGHFRVLGLLLGPSGVRGGTSGRRFLMTRKTNGRGETAMFAAAKAGHLNAVKELAYADVAMCREGDLGDVDGVTPLMTAARHNRAAVLEFLLNAEHLATEDGREEDGLEGERGARTGVEGRDLKQRPVTLTLQDGGGGKRNQQELGRNRGNNDPDKNNKKDTSNSATPTNSSNQPKTVGFLPSSNQPPPTTSATASPPTNKPPTNSSSRDRSNLNYDSDEERFGDDQDAFGLSRRSRGGDKGGNGNDGGNEKAFPDQHPKTPISGVAILESSTKSLDSVKTQDPRKSLSMPSAPHSSFVEGPYRHDFHDFDYLGSGFQSSAANASFGSNAEGHVYDNAVLRLSESMKGVWPASSSPFSVSRPLFGPPPPASTHLPPSHALWTRDVHGRTALMHAAAGAAPEATCVLLDELQFTGERRRWRGRERVGSRGDERAEMGSGFEIQNKRSEVQENRATPSWSPSRGGNDSYDNWSVAAAEKDWRSTEARNRGMGNGGGGDIGGGGGGGGTIEKDGRSSYGDVFRDGILKDTSR
eukprot:CAMPEP_0175056926 /NCGR_PEP_ID=MMETSP0052_2-20121109/10961_1 /TAXON_ID=51329 ORGANISM="Polytomella parva, Strain SAG 63-3" /NCGR_SAMPLE_ID=MMETSP0052_2 /ASSEMBLY_ACC=CAM_ASM_000194 /LENGTH=668 /DNA_ID=CAMNT_0016322045 /DNA_START=54 /DNA_END=2057 /DNA_ORIENTATION=+